MIKMSIVRLNAIAFICLILLCMACGASKTGYNATQITSWRTAQISPSNTPLPTITTEITPTIPAEVTPSAQRLAAATAVDYLSRRLNTDPRLIRVIQVTPNEWPDTSLGCAEKGRAYSRVMTPGYIILLEYDNQKFEVHTDRRGNAVMCDNNEQGQDDISSAIEERAVIAAKRELASKKGLQLGEIELVSIVPENWSDSSLGCPEPGMMYMQVITPGFRVRLKAEGEIYEVHTDRGGRAVLC